LYIKELYLRDFRSYQEQNICFSNKTNLILGDNGVGKSNLIEAIYMLSTSKSFSNVQDSKIKRWETDGYFIKGNFNTNRGNIDIALEYKKDKKSLYINGSLEKKISNIIGYIYCVVIFFDDIYLVIGAPNRRRSYLDLILSTVYPLYFKKLKLYINTLKHKNRYLKDNGNIDKTLLMSLNDQLIEAGSYIINMRLSLINFVNCYLEELNNTKNIIFPFRLLYKSNISQIEEKDDVLSIVNSFRRKLEKNIDKEIQYFNSIVGPHRDDFLFKDNKNEIRYFGSVGEARLSSILLKLAQAYFYYKKKDVVPILLLDDILLELDLKNMKNILSLFPEESQKIITTTEKLKLPETFYSDKVFYIYDKGKIK